MKMLRKLSAVLLFAALTLAVLAAANFLLVDDVHSYSRAMLQELYADAGKIDTLFLGSSHCYRSVDPNAVDAALGTYSFNAGSSQQLPDGSYYMLREAAAQNQLKTVYLEMFYTGYNQSASKNVPLACYLLTDHMRWNSPNRYAYQAEMGGMAAFDDLLLPARHGVAEPQEMPALWRAKLTDGYALGNYSYLTYADEGESYRGRGFVYTSGAPENAFHTLLDVDPEAPLSDFGWEYLRKTAEFCQENGINLVLFTAPLPSAYLYNTTNYLTYADEGESYRGRGFVYTSGAPENAFHTLLDVDPEAPLSDFGWEYLRKTAEFCQENGINLVLFTAPLPSAYLYNTANYQAYVDALRDFAAENNTVYWDFSLYKDVDTLNLLVGDFSDAHHLNGQGAEKFTAVLCDTIARENAGEDVSTLFYDTVEEKLELTPDQSIAMAHL